MRSKWKREHGAAGWVYRNADRGITVLQLSSDQRKSWFISRGLSYVENKRGDVRLFWTPEGAMRAAEKL